MFQQPIYQPMAMVQPQAVAVQPNVVQPQAQRRRQRRKRPQGQRPFPRKTNIQQLVQQEIKRIQAPIATVGDRNWSQPSNLRVAPEDPQDLRTLSAPGTQAVVFREIFDHLRIGLGSVTSVDGHVSVELNFKPTKFRLPQQHPIEGFRPQSSTA
ncbi:putative nucleoprotein [Serpentovirinae sp. isolate C18]|uniref:Nucleoprotein n=1 Tax=Serpentovirinae sp. isolate C18 TaxID=3071291 RepID=A0AAE6TW00_9NIDO|nr:putative nucleoprotein [Serpentovirinae sp.]QFU19720.1 putative nucleoprotein [Serpentovirinae sp.]